MVDEFIDWRGRSKCRTLTPNEYDKLFFPHAGRSINKAKEFCKDCPVITECLERALQTGALGVWGGTCKTDRDRILRLQNGGGSAKVKVKRNKSTRTNFVFS